MVNELRDIANRLCKFDTIEDGWQIVSAIKQSDGTWDLVIKPFEESEEKEAADDNN